MNIRFGRIMLRAIEPEDLKLVQFLFNDPETNEFTEGWDFPVSIDHQLDWFSKIKNDSNTKRFMIENEEGKAIGTISLNGIDYRNRTAFIGGIKILKEYQGKGYAQASMMAVLKTAFEYLNLHLVESSLIMENKNSFNMIKKIGFVLEGTLRSRLYKHGRRYDKLICSVTADEYWKIKERYENY